MMGWTHFRKRDLMWILARAYAHPALLVAYGVVMAALGYVVGHR